MKRPQGVYPDGRGGWYFKISLGRDAITKKERQITRRGFATAGEAAQARRDCEMSLASGGPAPTRSAAPAAAAVSTPAVATPDLTLNELLDLYLTGLEADGQLAPKTRFDNADRAKHYIRPVIGHLRVSEVTSKVILEWQRHLATQGGAKNGQPLAPNTIRLARAVLSGAFRTGLLMGVVAVNPLIGVPQPKRRRSIPRHWSPESARAFLGFMESDRTWPIWAVLLGTGLRIGEFVAIRWPSVDIDRRLLRVVDFSSALGYEVVPSVGNSRDAIRTSDLDDGLVKAFKMQRAIQAQEQLVADEYVNTDLAFTKPAGGPYHPQGLSRLLAQLSVEAGLPRLTAHGLRHSSATLMLASGVPPKVAAERLGHADPTLFTNLYSHVTPTMQRDAAERLGTALFG
jgi:integrase